MLDIPTLLIIIVALALVFDFTNGAHDCANAIATVVSTKVLSPKVAVFMAASLNLLGALLGEEVAKTVGGGIIDAGLIQNGQILVLAGLLGAIFWNTLTWYLGIPSSSSHALIGGLIGAGLASVGTQALNMDGIIYKVILPLVLSPLAGFIISYIVMMLILFIFQNFNRIKLSHAFSKLQIVSSAAMATSHGFNDAQKTMGVITLALVQFNYMDGSNIHIPFWVKISCAMAMAVGTATGGWKIIKTMGHKIFKMEPVHGFAVETSAAIVIAAASTIGAPISTTHTITTCVFGVGATKRLSAVRWGVAGNLLIAWIITIPASALTSFLFFTLLTKVLN